MTLLLLLQRLKAKRRKNSLPEEILLNYDIRDPAQIGGSPKIDYDFKFFGNLGIELGSQAELYLFPSFAKREVEGGFYFRNPVTRGGVFLMGKRKQPSRWRICERIPIRPPCL